jgi:hypothetical protein
MSDLYVIFFHWFFFFLGGGGQITVSSLLPNLFIFLLFPKYEGTKRINTQNFQF